MAPTAERPSRQGRSARSGGAHVGDIHKRTEPIGHTAHCSRAEHRADARARGWSAQPPRGPVGPCYSRYKTNTDRDPLDDHHEIVNAVAPGDGDPYGPLEAF